MVLLVLQIKCGAKIIKPWLGVSMGSSSRILRDIYNDFAGGVLDKGESIPENFNTLSIQGSVGKSKTDLTQVDMNATIGEVTGILGSFIEFNVAATSESNEYDDDDSSRAQTSAFSVLKMASTDKTKLPDKFKETTERNKLKNSLIDWLSTENVGWSLQEKGFLGVQFVNTLSSVLWHIDGNHATLSQRGCRIPDAFTEFSGYNNPESHKKRKISSDTLKQETIISHAEQLLVLGNQAYMKMKTWRGVRDKIIALSNQLQKYSSYLKEQCKKMKLSHEKLQFVQTEREVWHTYDGNRKLTHLESQQYGRVNRALKDSEFFEPICLNDFTSGVPWEKFKFLKDLALTSKAVRYTYTGGNKHLDFAWRVPESHDEASLISENIKVRERITPNIPKYHSRTMKRTFIQLFGSITNTKSAILRKAYSYLTDDESASRTLDEAELDKRVSEMIDLQDPELITDLRINNQGQPERFDVFLQECQKYINQHVETAVDDRRHDAVSDSEVVVHFAVALNAQDLHTEVQKRCPENTPIPSVQWLRLQFWPKRVNSAAAGRYYGTIKVKYMVQSRQLRQNHEDMHYASALFRYLKEFCVKFREITTLVCMDDKHTMKIGEPGLPLAAIERGKTVLVAMGTRFQVADHDFSRFSMIPSVILHVDIPDVVEESWYRGQAHVGLKEHAFEPSSPLRHATELHQVVENDPNPILALYTDGGPDHRTNLLSVQTALICLFLQEDRDMVVAVRTPPYNSWKDPAERVMCVLNIAAQSVGLMRTSTDIEGVLVNCSGLKKLRALNEENPGLQVKEKVLESVQPCKDLLADRFRRVTFSKNPLQTFTPATQDSMDNLWNRMQNIDPTLTRSDTTRVVVQNKVQFQDFYTKHCRDRHYWFSVKKCNDQECKYHLPPRALNFDEIHHLPDPVPNGQRYTPFTDLYGTETSEKHRPSLTTRAKPDKGMPFAPTKQTALNVGQVIQCDDCGKWRVLHSKYMLKGNSIDMVSDYLSHISFSCGSILQNDEMDVENDFLRNVYVRADLTCQSTIELPYYSAKYEDICYYCGAIENGEAAEYYPRCAACHSTNKRPLVKRRTRTFKPKKTVAAEAAEDTNTSQ